MPSPAKVRLYEGLRAPRPAAGPEPPAAEPGEPPPGAAAAPDPYEPYRRFYSNLAETERLPRAGLDRHRDGLLRRLAEFAHAHSPFHRERLAPLFRRGAEPDLAAWREVPIMRRADLETAIDRINPAAIPAEFGQVTTLRTSGSTGGRLAFRSCLLARVAAECMMHRLYVWHGLDTAAAMASIRYYGSGRRQYPDGVTEPRWSFVGAEGPHHTIDLRHPLPDLVDWLERRAPKYLLTFPSIALDLALYRTPSPGRFAPAGIVGISEIVTPEVRAAVRERFGCEIAQIYACSEMGCIALQAPQGEHCLVCEETVLVEILDERGNPVGPGGTGRVVLTSLYNYATPFIRYEIGDVATLAAEPCPSGRALMRIERIEGRRRNALLREDGGRIWPHRVAASELPRLLSSAQFQVRQNGAREIEVLYVAEPGAPAPDAAGLAAVFTQWLGRPPKLSLSAVDAIARTAGGKREIVVSALG
jgi:phenylacetate-CoA ligase